MMKAKELLIETNLTVENVSKNVGYFSVSHFIKLFTQHFSCLPSSIKANSIIDGDGIKETP